MDFTSLVRLVSAMLASVAGAQETRFPVPNPETRAEAAGWGKGSSWMAQHERCAQMVVGRRVDVVLLGDSITQGFGDPARGLPSNPGREAWERWLAPLHAADFGISGDRTQHVLWRIEHGAFDHVEPKVVVLMIGTNNLTAGDAPSDVAAGIDAIVERLADDAFLRIVVLGVLPRGEREDDPQRRRVMELNRLVRERCERDPRVLVEDPQPAGSGAPRLLFRDLSDVFVGSDGAARAGLFAGDWLHLQAAGYAAWAEAMAPTLRQILDPALLEEAARVKPHPRQVAWQELEFTAFVHFGINTFTDREWGEGDEDPALFNPTDFDADQWITTFKDAGMKGVILTAKHHDGFCLWPSEFTGHSVKNSPWRGGKGDVVREVSDACRRHGLKFGVYLSPADLHEKSYGDSPKYNAFFRNQLHELLSNYGELFEVWFDGATPRNRGQVYDYPTWYRLIRDLQPNAVIAIGGPDVRWVGNEAGNARPSEWSVIPAHGSRLEPRWPDATAADLGSLEQLRAADFLSWYPAETDTSIRPGWFWHASQDAQVRSLDDLLDCWYGAVGGNSLLLLNVPPDSRGRIATPDARRLHELGTVLRATFGTNAGGGIEAPPQTLIGPEGPNRFGLSFPEPKTFNRIVLREDIARSGQRIDELAVHARVGGVDREIAHTTTVGFKRILRVATVSTDQITVHVERARAAPDLLSIGLYFEPPRLRAPELRRGRDGLVTMTCDRSASGADAIAIHFTLDGSAPTSASPRFEQPFGLPDGGTVRALAIAPDDAPVLRLGDGTESRTDFGPAKTNWKVIRVDSEEIAAEDGSAANAIDDDPATMWHTEWSRRSPKPPHEITIDLGAPLDVTAFTYLPRMGGGNGTVLHFQVFVLPELDARLEPVAGGEFENIANHPVEQVVRFEKPARGRYLRFVALDEIEGRAWTSAAEIGVLTR